MSDTIVAFNNEILFRKSFSFFGSSCGIVLIFLENIHPWTVTFSVMHVVLAQIIKAKSMMIDQSNVIIKLPWDLGLLGLNKQI